MERVVFKQIKEVTRSEHTDVNGNIFILQDTTGECVRCGYILDFHIDINLYVQPWLKHSKCPKCMEEEL